MLAAFQEHLKKTFPNLQQQRLLVAISGGLDSVALTHLLHELEYKISLAHCNFNLRAVESDGDEQFVKQLSSQLAVEHHLAHFSTEAYAQEKSMSIQMAARELRYNFFDEVCDSHSYDYVLTAHHLDDQLETFLINLNRGAGLQGLQGIPQVNGKVIRPLLPFSREEIYKYAVKNGLSWREDSSNSSNKYQRNQLRNEILPQLHNALPELKSHFSQTLDYLRGSQLLVEDAVARFRESAITTTSQGLKIHIEQLEQSGSSLTYLYHIIKDYGFRNVDDVYGLIASIKGKRVASSTHVVYREGNYLVIEKLEEVQLIHEVIDAIPSQIEFYNHKLLVEEIRSKHALELVKKDFKDTNILYLDAHKLHLPLQLRRWKNGDRIKPYGMKGSKLVSDLLTDSKVSFISKEKIVVLTLNEDILWVVGIRSSKFHTVSASTTRLIKLTYI